MNEKELKQIWGREEVIPLKNIDMEFIQQYTLNTQNSLQKLSRKELIYGGIISALLTFDFIYSGNFYIVLSSLAIVWIFIIWKSRRDARLDNLSRSENVKNYLTCKEKALKREIKLWRISSFFGVVVFTPFTNMLNGSFYERMTNPLRYIITLTITTIVVQIFVEFYVRRNYQPILEDLRYLTEQFDENENA